MKEELRAYIGAYVWMGVYLEKRQMTFVVPTQLES